MISQENLDLVRKIVRNRESYDVAAALRGPDVGAGPAVTSNCDIATRIKYLSTARLRGYLGMSGGAVSSDLPVIWPLPMVVGWSHFASHFNSAAEALGIPQTSGWDRLVSIYLHAAGLVRGCHDLKFDVRDEFDIWSLMRPAFQAFDDEAKFQAFDDEAKKEREKGK